MPVNEMIETRSKSQYNLLSRPRYLRRTWKLFKPYLQASDSLPDLALIPHERPFYTCDSCGFSNSRAERCLWCPPNLEREAKEDGRESQFLYRRRRVSAPAMLLCWQNSQHTTSTPRRSSLPLKLSPRPVSPRALSRFYLSTARGRNTLDGNRPTLPRLLFTGNTRPTSPRLLFTGNTLPKVEEDGINMVRNISSEITPSHGPNQVKRASQAAVVHGDVVTATVLPSCSTFTSRPFVGSSDDPGADPQSASKVSSAIGGDHNPRQSLERASSSSSTDCVERKSPVVENPVMNSMTRLTMTSSRSLSSHIVVDLRNGSPHEANFKDLPMASSDLSVTQRTLRRKKRQSALHMSAPPSSCTETESKVPLPARPQSQPTMPLPSTLPDNHTGPMPITKSQMYNGYHSASQHDVHLGHPNRPYYTALRADMSRPSSALDYHSRPNSRASSPILFGAPPLTFLPGSGSSIGFDIGVDLPSTATFAVPPLLSPSSNNLSAASSTLFPFTPFGLNPDTMLEPGLKRTNSTSSTSLKHFTLALPFSRKARRHTSPEFSKGDEIKLRMALAREVGGKDVRADEGYVYRDSDERERRGSMKFQMKKIGKGIKDLVKRRS